MTTKDATSSFCSTSMNFKTNEMGNENPNNPSLFKGLSLSILLGVVAFTVSLVILISTVHVDYSLGIVNSSKKSKDSTIVKKDSLKTKFNIYFSDHTKFYVPINGKTNNLVISNDSIYNRYKSGERSSVFMMDINSKNLKKTYRPKTNQFQYQFNEKYVDTCQTTYYFMKSKYIYDKIFYSTDTTKLYSFIQENDSIAKIAIDNTYKDLQSSKKLFFNQHPKLLIWIILISIAISFSSSIVPFFTSEIVKYFNIIKSYNILISSIGTSLFIIAMLITPLAFIMAFEYDYMILPSDLSAFFSTGFGNFGLFWSSTAPYFGVVFWLILILMRFAAAGKIHMNIKLKVLNRTKTKKEYSKNIQYFNNVENYFEKQFVILAIFLAFTIICTELFISSLNNIVLEDPKGQIFPNQFSFTNGLIQTFFLGMIYFYIHGGLAKMKAKINRVKKEEDETDPPDITEIKLNPAAKPLKQYIKFILATLAPVIGVTLQKLLDIIIGS